MGVTISTVAVNAHGTAESAEPGQHRPAGGGKYYAVNNPNKALPRIFQKEARRVSRPLVYEPHNSFPVKQVTEHPMMSGVSELPPISGYVLTSKKENPLVETVLLATKPGGEDNTTILAGWNYGLGRAVAFTTDAGLQWTPGWAGSPAATSSSPRSFAGRCGPPADRASLTATFEPLEGKMRVVVTALDDKNEFLNFLTMTGTAVGPDLKKPLDLEIEQTGAGPLRGHLPRQRRGKLLRDDQSGPRHGAVADGRERALFRRVPRPRAQRRPLDPACRRAAQGRPAGPIDRGPGRARRASTSCWQFNTFRHDLPKATSSQEAWHWLVLMASCVFLGDVFIRRVSVNFAWVPPLLAGCAISSSAASRRRPSRSTSSG